MDDAEKKETLWQEWKRAQDATIGKQEADQAEATERAIWYRQILEHYAKQDAAQERQAAALDRIAAALERIAGKEGG